MNKYVFYIALFFSGFISAQEFTVQLDSTDLIVGQQAQLKLNYIGSQNYIWTYFNDEDEIIENLEVVSSGNYDTISIDNNEIHLQQSISITAWDSGYFAIPPFKIEVNGDTIESNPLLIHYALDNVDLTGELKSNKDQAKTPFTFDEIKELVYWLTGILLFIIGLTILIVYLIRKNKNKPQITTPTPTRPKIEILWERFHELSKNKDWKIGKEKEFQVELSHILKETLELKYHIKANESTTGEIIQQLSAIGIEKEILENCKHILNFSDMIKFAKHKGVDTQHENALSNLKSFLEAYTIE